MCRLTVIGILPITLVGWRKLPNAYLHYGYTTSSGDIGAAPAAGEVGGTVAFGFCRRRRPTAERGEQYILHFKKRAAATRERFVVGVDVRRGQQLK
jgi:hypothetical protein